MTTICVNCGKDIADRSTYTPTVLGPMHPSCWENGQPLKDMVQDVKNFHRKFELAYEGPPRELPRDLSAFRSMFMNEELVEYDFAVQKGDKEKQLDALVDLVYVALGTAHLHGFNFREAWRRVHEANMKKVKTKSDGSDSKRKSLHDVVKPEGWTAPDLSDLV